MTGTRPTRWWRRLAFAAASLTAVESALAQAAAGDRSSWVRGRVADAETAAPVARVSLAITRGSDTLAAGQADSLGSFSFLVRKSDSLAIHLRRLGYRPAIQRLAVADGSALTLTMIAIPRSLDAVAVIGRVRPSARLAGFDDRVSRKAGGTFITREYLDAWHPTRTSDVIRRVLGVKLIDSAGITLIASTRGTKVDLRKGIDIAPCVLRIAVDGQIKEWGFSVNDIDPDVIHGIEVYNGPATIPSEFNGLRSDGYCGLVIIWTRSGG